MEESAAFLTVIMQSPALTPVITEPEAVQTFEGDAVYVTSPVPDPPDVDIVI